MTVNNISSIVGATQPANQATNTGSQELGSEDFLKLLTVQLSNQNPLEPMKDTDFIAQMANFSSLEQMKNINTTLSQLTQDQLSMGATNYLGKEVLYFGNGGITQKGLVTAVSVTDGALKLNIGNEVVDASNIQKIYLSQD